LLRRDRRLRVDRESARDGQTPSIRASLLRIDAQPPVTVIMYRFTTMETPQ
jgi:hypothetical protein